MSLYLKHRPSDFKGVLGNVEQIKTLKKAITSDSPSHVYLLSGERGIGKTTLARICAKELDAATIGIRELNFSDKTSIEDARDLIESVKYPPMLGSVSVYICDEFHRLSKNGQDALLKLFEDGCPAHAYFFLCTTEASKVRDTIRSRCMCINLKPLQQKVIKKILTIIMVKENIEHISDEVLDAIIMESSGSARDAIQLMEQVAMLDDEDAMYHIIDSGVHIDTDVYKLYNALSKNEGWGLISLTLQKLRSLKDAESIRHAVLAMANNSLLKKAKDKDAIILECFAEPFYDSGFPGLTLACFQTYKQLSK